MPRKSSPPNYLKKKVGNTTYARTKLFGQEISLGLYGSEESFKRLEEVRAQWRAGPTGYVKPTVDLTVADLAFSWMEHVERNGLYRHKDGTPTTELEGWRSSLVPLRRLFESKLAREFGPRDLKALQASMATGSWMRAEDLERGTRVQSKEKGYCRKTVNQRIRRVVRLFAFGVSEELIPVEVYQALLTVPSLPAGTKLAKDYPEIGPAPEQDVKEVLGWLKPIPRAIALLQLATGMRPGEACAMRKDEIDRLGVDGAWVHRPAAHKTARHGITRAIALGPGAQFVLAPLMSLPGEWVFPGRRRNGKPFQVNTYIHNVLHACRAAKVPEWSPNQLRKAAATSTEEQLDLDHARAQLGHTSSSTTKRFYARGDLKKAARAARLG